jgi:hypothetical protein
LSQPLERIRPGSQQRRYGEAVQSNGSLSIRATGKNSGAPLLTSFELMHARVNGLFTATMELCALPLG